MAPAVVLVPEARVQRLPHNGGEIEFLAIIWRLRTPDLAL
jgi:hypothetical protein